MSALPSAAARRLFILGSQKVPPSFLERLSDFPKLSGVTPASRLEVRPTPEMVTSGIREIDALTGGFPRGCLTEICGPASSGRTSVLLAALAASTRRAEVCALVDAGNTLDPHSAAAAGIDLEKLLWVRCGKKKQKNHFPQTQIDTDKDLSILDQVLRIVPRLDLQIDDIRVLTQTAPTVDLGTQSDVSGFSFNIRSGVLPTMSRPG